ncbi:MAG: hypothetical protein CL438_08610 [Acidimicrobiaceae bacterium]|nr:hypothetical protein [Acidimicrobiaceae bacterium]
MQVDWQHSNVQSNYRGTVNTAVETGPGKGKAAMLEPDRRGTGVAVMSHSCSGNSKSKDQEMPGGEVKTERRTPLSGTLDRSNPNRELVKRKLSSDSRQRIRKQVR